MATVVVENVPEDLYEALRARAQANQKSISDEVLELLAQNVPTPAELRRRRELFDLAIKMRASIPAGSYPSAEELIREDRER